MDEKFKAPIFKKLKVKDVQTEVDKIISLYKQPTMFKVLLRKLSQCRDEILKEQAFNFLEKLMNIMLNGCKEDKLFYKAVTKLSNNIPNESLLELYKKYAICMIMKWKCDYKFVFYVKKRFESIFADEKTQEIIEKYVTDKGVRGRLR